MNEGRARGSAHDKGQGRRAKRDARSWKTADDAAAWRAERNANVRTAMCTTKTQDGDVFVDEAALAAHFGTNPPDKDELDRDKEFQKRRKEATERRKGLRTGIFKNEASMRNKSLRPS